MQARRLPEHVILDYNMITLGCGKQEQNCHNWVVLVAELLREMILAKQPILYILQILLAGAATRPAGWAGNSPVAFGYFGL